MLPTFVRPAAAGSGNLAFADPLAPSTLRQSGTVGVLRSNGEMSYRDNLASGSLSKSPVTRAIDCKVRPRGSTKVI